MYECVLKLKKEIDGSIINIILTQNEIRKIWSYYELYLTDERIWQRIQDNYGASDFKKYKTIISDIVHKYEKNLSYGCDDEFSMNTAFEEMSDELEKIK